MKEQESQKNIYSCFIDYAKAFDCVDHNTLLKILQEMGIPDQTTWTAFWEICMQVQKLQLEPDMKWQTGSKLGKECVKAVYCHPAYLTHMQSVCLFAQSYLTLWPHELEPGSSVHGIHQSIIQKWVAI